MVAVLEVVAQSVGIMDSTRHDAATRHRRDGRTCRTLRSEARCPLLVMLMILGPAVGCGTRYAEPPTTHHSKSDVYHPYDATVKAELAPLFTAIRDLVPREGQVSVEGFATFQWRALAGGGHVVTVSPHDGLIECANGGPVPQISLDQRLLPDLAASRIALLEGHLRSLCTRTRDGDVDVLLGAGLAMGVSELEGYEGRNPRTGQAIKVPPKRLPYFIGW